MIVNQKFLIDNYDDKRVLNIKRNRDERTDKD